MTYRVTDRDIDRACESLTSRMRDAGELHPDAVFARTGAYGRTGVAVTGGPYYGTGSSDLIPGATKRECLDTLHAIARAAELGRRSLQTPIGGRQ